MPRKRMRGLALRASAAVAVVAVGACSSASNHGSARLNAARSTGSPTVLTIDVHPVQLTFVTAAGASSHFPTGPLAPGDRIIGTDDISQAGAVVGHDIETCTVAFGLHVLCDDMLSWDKKGDLHTTWVLQWPSTGTQGPSSFDGVIDGGTAAFRHATGDFHAVALPPSHDLHITATFTQ